MSNATEDASECYYDEIAQRAVAVSTLLATADTFTDDRFKAEALLMAEAVRHTFEKPKASVSRIDGGRSKPPA